MSRVTFPKTNLVRWEPFPLPPLDKMATCIAIVKTTLEVCGKSCEGERCRVHQRVWEKECEKYGVPGANQCLHISTGKNAHRCVETKQEGRQLCQHHWRNFAETGGIAKTKKILEDGVTAFAPQNMSAYDIVDHIVTPQLRERMLEVFDGEWSGQANHRLMTFLPGKIWFARPATDSIRLIEYIRSRWHRIILQEDIPALPHPTAHPQPQQTQLAALANDPQNTHTKVVTDATNKATAILLDRIKHLDHTIIAPTHWMNWLAVAWLTRCGKNYGPMSHVIADMGTWWNKAECRQKNDYLYRRLLMGVADIIYEEKDEEKQTELLKRLYEECDEARGMCCDGHITRLCNVFVGFDEAFQPQMSSGEQLQQEMAALAGADVSDEEKRERAREVLERLHVPADQHGAWLEAF